MDNEEGRMKNVRTVRIRKVYQCRDLKDYDCEYSFLIRMRSDKKKRAWAGRVTSGLRACRADSFTQTPDELWEIDGMDIFGRSEANQAPLLSGPTHMHCEVG